MRSQAERDRELQSLGYDRAAQAGRLADYLRMMNRGGSGGYSDHRIADADRLDATTRDTAAG